MPKWWHGAFWKRYLSKDIKAVRVQASRNLKKNVSGKGNNKCEGSKAERMVGVLAKDKNVAGEKGMRGMGWEDMRSERLREACRS